MQDKSNMQAAPYRADSWHSIIKNGTSTIAKERSTRSSR